MISSKQLKLSKMLCTVCLIYVGIPCFGQKVSTVPPRVIILGVNGMEWDIVRPLLVRGEMPNLAKMMDRGTAARLRTISSPNCPKVYTAIETSTLPDENGITGFLVNGTTANTNMLKKEPLWSILSRHSITVGMANVPATFPVLPVNGYMISGMLTRGKDCEDGVLCSPKLSEVQAGDAVFPASMTTELLSKVGDFYIDCARMPSQREIDGNETQVVTTWLAKVQTIREQQSKLFDYLLTKHPTDFTFLVQSCEDRVGHWLYPIQPFNVGYNAKLAGVNVDAFPDQYRALDKIVGKLLSHVDSNTYLFILSDHGIKPLRYSEPPHAHADHAGTTPVIAKHDYDDGDEVPGALIVMGPGIKENSQIFGLDMSVLDIAPTILHIYGIEKPPQMRGRVLNELFVDMRRETAEPHAAHSAAAH